MRSPPFEVAPVPRVYLIQSRSAIRLGCHAYFKNHTLHHVSIPQPAIVLLDWSLLVQRCYIGSSVRPEHIRFNRDVTYLRNRQSSSCGGIGVALLISPANGLVGLKPLSEVKHAAGWTSAGCVPLTVCGGLGAWKRNWPTRKSILVSTRASWSPMLHMSETYQLEDWHIGFRRMMLCSYQDWACLGTSHTLDWRPVELLHRRSRFHWRLTMPVDVATGMCA